MYTNVTQTHPSVVFLNTELNPAQIKRIISKARNEHLSSTISVAGSNVKLTFSTEGGFHVKN